MPLTPQAGAISASMLAARLEMRGMSDHEYEPYVLGQKSNGYLIKQTITTLDSTVRAIADGSIETKDTSFWDTLAEQRNRQSEDE